MVKFRADHDGRVTGFTTNGMNAKKID